MLPERIECRLCQFNPREADGGERREREFCEGYVVEAYDREILWHSEALEICGAQDADGRHVVRTDDCCGLGTEILQLVESGNTTFESVIALDDPFFLDI